MKQWIDPVVFEIIARHFRKMVPVAIEEYAESEAHEDSLTTALCKALAKRSTKITTDKGTWRFRIRHRSFYSGNTDSEETIIGADALFQIQIFGEYNEIVESKGLLLQSKKKTNAGRKKLYQQLANMEAFAEGSSAMFEFDPEVYKAIRSSDALQHRDRGTAFPDMPLESLADYLVDKFLVCLVGLRNLYYDFDREVLVVPKHTAGVALVRAMLRDSLAIEVFRPMKRDLGGATS